MSSREYHECVRCLMDTTDPDIVFDEEGVCNHCRRYDMLAGTVLADRESPGKLESVVDRIRRSGAGCKYDSILGISGGVDSTYLAYVAKQVGLRPLAVHLDNGWNTESAERNIARALEILGIDLYTRVIDWDEFRDLQVAFLKASTPDAEIPTDHAIMATLYQEASERGVKYILLGTNIRTEAVLPKAWARGHLDWRYIRSVHRRFGSSSLRTYPHLSAWDFVHYTFFKGIRTVSLLDMVEYRRDTAKSVLAEELGWEDYGTKHGESVYTRFLQSYILPKKFGIDKRKAHLSSLICSGEISKESARRLLQQSPYSADEIEQDRRYVLAKLGLSDSDFELIMAQPPQSIADYPCYETDPFVRAGKRLYKLITANRLIRL